MNVKFVTMRPHSLKLKLLVSNPATSLRKPLPATDGQVLQAMRGKRYWRAAIWLIAWSPALFALGQTFIGQPLLSPLTSGLILLVTGLLAGLRISADSVQSYMAELQRKNNFLAALSRGLAEQNLRYLRRFQADLGDDSVLGDPSESEQI